VTEAFRLKQALDDVVPDSEREKREWTLQIIALTEQADEALTSQDATFAGLRRLEVNAAGTLADVRARVTAASARITAARSTLADLEKKYVATSFAGVVGNVAAAESQLAAATRAADAAEPAISASGVNAVSATLDESSQAAHRADQLLDAVDRTARDLAAADAALAELRSRTAADLVEAKAQRDSAPDAETGEAIIRAIAGVEGILAERHTGPADPVAQLDSLGDAVAQLDAALASARNQAQRLQHARDAYAGTLVSATSQIAAARDYIGSRGGGVQARTRLAEAERQLMLAQAQTDPVEALDTIRRAVTHARDADALARFDTMG
jgi:chromosome segregation ATPase